MAWTNTPTAKGKITAALVTEIQAAIDLKAETRRGTSTTAGEAGRTITLSPVEADANYDVFLSFSVDVGPNVGAAWVAAADKAVDSFIVRNVGDAGKAFSWLLVRY